MSTVCRWLYFCKHRPILFLYFCKHCPILFLYFCKHHPILFSFTFASIIPSCSFTFASVIPTLFSVLKVFYSCFYCVQMAMLQFISSGLPKVSHSSSSPFLFLPIYLYFPSSKCPFHSFPPSLSLHTCSFLFSNNLLLLHNSSVNNCDCITVFLFIMHVTSDHCFVCVTNRIIFLEPVFHHASLYYTIHYHNIWCNADIHYQLIV